MTHTVEPGDIWESTGLVKVSYLILGVDENGRIVIHNMTKDETTFVYDGFFSDDHVFKWRKAA